MGLVIVAVFIDTESCYLLGEYANDVTLHRLSKNAAVINLYSVLKVQCCFVESDQMLRPIHSRYSITEPAPSRNKSSGHRARWRSGATSSSREEIAREIRHTQSNNPSLWLLKKQNTIGHNSDVGSYPKGLHYSCNVAFGWGYILDQFQNLW